MLNYKKMFYKLNVIKFISHLGVLSELKYDVGRSYIFDVKSRTVLKVRDGNHADVIQTAQAHISVHSSCEFSLKVIILDSSIKLK